MYIQKPCPDWHTHTHDSICWKLIFGSDDCRSSDRDTNSKKSDDDLSGTCPIFSPISVCNTFGDDNICCQCQWETRHKVWIDPLTTEPRFFMIFVIGFEFFFALGLWRAQIDLQSSASLLISLRLYCNFLFVCWRLIHSHITSHSLFRSASFQTKSSSSSRDKNKFLDFFCPTEFLFSVKKKLI